MKPYDILIAAYWRSHQANKFAALTVAGNVRSAPEFEHELL